MKKNGCFVVGSGLVFCACSLFSSFSRAAPYNPVVESRLDLGLATVRAPMKPVVLAPARFGTPAAQETESAYTAFFARMRMMVPYEADTFTLAGGFSLSLFPGNASLAITNPIGPDGRYLSQYALHTRLESEWRDFVLAAGCSFTLSRMDYVEFSIVSFEPQGELEARGTLREWIVLKDSFSPALQFAFRTAPVGSTWRVRKTDAVAPNENGTFGVGKSGRLAVYAAEAAVGVHALPEAARQKRILREGVFLVGALYETRTYSDFLTKRNSNGTTTPFADSKGGVFAAFLSIQGFLP